MQNYFFFFPQNAIVSVKELCGLPPIASLKQCILTLSSRLVSSENAPSVTLCMKDAFPYLEPLGTVPDVQKKVLAAYDLVGASHCYLCLFPWLQKWQASCWLSSAWKFLLNEWSSSGNLNYAKLSYHSNHNSGHFLVVPFFPLNMAVTSTCWHFRSDFVYESSSSSACTRGCFSLSLRRGKICVSLCLSPLSREQGHQIGRQSCAVLSQCLSAALYIVSVSLLKPIKCLCLRGHRRNVLKCPLLHVGREKVVWYRSTCKM